MSSSEQSSNVSSGKQLFDEFPPISREEWEDQIREDLKGKNYRQILNWEPSDQLDFLPFYRWEDTEELDYLRHTPGTFPFARSVHSSGNPWKICEYIHASNLEQASEKISQALDMGSEALAFTMRPHPSSSMLGGDLEGIPIQHQSHFATLLKDIDLSSVALHFDAGMATPGYLAMINNYIQQKNISPEIVRASFKYDPFSFIARHGKHPSSNEKIGITGAQMVDFCSNHLPRIRPLAVTLHPYHYAGGSVVQELGIALAVGQAYLSRLSDQGVDPSDIARHIYFDLPIGTSYFLEIAKIRTLRLLWSRILEAYLPDEKPIPHPVIHAETSRWSHSVYDAHNNMVRNTSQAMAAIIGGCDSLAITPHDSLYENPTDFSRRIARNIQHILRDESHLDQVADPAGGSYYIETLTDELARYSWDFFQEIEKQDGFLRALEGGFIQSAIQHNRQKLDKKIASGSTTFVGINNFPNTEQHIQNSSHSSYTATSLTRSGDNPKVNQSNLINSLSEIFKNGAHLGDVINQLVQSSRHHIQTIHPYRGPRSFEQLRHKTDSYAKKNGARPRILLAPIGDPAIRKQRANFVSNLLGCGGYELIEPLGFESAKEIMDRVQEDAPDMLVVCSPDELYKSVIATLSTNLENLDHSPLLAIAGKPEGIQEMLTESQVDYFIHARSNRLELLQNLHQQFGIT